MWSHLDYRQKRLDGGQRTLDHVYSYHLLCYPNSLYRVGQKRKKHLVVARSDTGHGHRQELEALRLDRHPDA